MKKTLVFTISLAVISAGCDKSYFIAPPPSHAVIAEDNSLSIKPDCVGLANQVRRITEASDFAAGSTLTLLVIGVSASSPQPVRLFDNKLPVAPDSVFGRDDAGSNAEREKYFEGLQEACAAAPPSKASPILRLVRDSVAHLRSRGCDAKSHCVIVAQTDLREEMDETLRIAVNRAVTKPNIQTPEALKHSIDNAGITIAFCSGQAQAITGQREASPESLQKLWTGIFTHPALVSFKPYCGV